MTLYKVGVTDYTETFRPNHRLVQLHTYDKVQERTTSEEPKFKCHRCMSPLGSDPLNNDQCLQQDVTVGQMMNPGCSLQSQCDPARTKRLGILSKCSNFIIQNNFSDLKTKKSHRPQGLKWTGIGMKLFLCLEYNQHQEQSHVVLALTCP